VISDRQEDELTKKLHFIGSDQDTGAFWNVHGEWTDEKTGKFVAYFSHRQDGTPDLHGELSDAGIAWDATGSRGSATWVPMQTPSFKLKSQTFKDPNKVGGFYVEKTIYSSKANSFAGVRLIGANYFPNITFVGTDDGTSFWSVVGNWDNTHGQFRADFTAIGRGGKTTTGKVDHFTGSVVWTDGQFWQKECILPAVMPVPPTVMTV